MPNLIDHLNARGHIAPSEAPLSRGDCLLLSQIAYANLPEAAPSLGAALETALHAPPNPHRFGIEHRMDKPLLEGAARSLRFANLPFLGFREIFDADSACQFAGFALRWDENTLIVSFRGTDSSFAGWKENFMLAYRSSVPAQAIAVDFLREVMEKHAGGVICCGHSKGGHLATYAAAFARPGERLREVLSFDGPGLSPADFASTEFLAIRGRVRVFVPRASLVGLLFAQPPGVRYISAPGPLPHYPYAWRVEHGDFVPARAPSRLSAFSARTLHRFIGGMGPTMLEAYVEALFLVISSSGVDSAPELLRQWRRSVPRVLSAAVGLDPGTRRLFFRTLRIFLRAVAGRLP